MSYVIAAPEMLATTAADVDGIGSAIRAASASAAGPTTGLLAAAADEVSSAAAALFSEYARECQEVLKQAAGLLATRRGQSGLRRLQRAGRHR